MALRPHATRSPQWLITGLLLDDNRFVRQSGFASDDAAAPTAQDRDSPLRVELLDANEQLLLRGGVPVVTPCVDGPGADPPFRVVLGTVPLPLEATRARFLLDDILLEDFRFPSGEPTVKFDMLPEANARGVARIAWIAKHPDGAPLTHLLGYSFDNGETWHPLGPPTDLEEADVDLDALAGGEQCRFLVATTDGVRTVRVVSDPVAFPAKPSLAMILDPAPNTRLVAGEPLHLAGQGYWREERRPEQEALAWSSSLAGALGTGASIEAVGLAPGTHEITLVAGEGDRAGSASVTVTVVEERKPK